MIGPLLSSKYRLPVEPAGAVRRERLAGRVARALQGPLTVVSAPAGFGKTTLLAQALADAATGGAAVAWVSLDGRDNDPSLFWSYVVSAVRAAAPALADPADRLLASPPPATDVLVTTLLNAIDPLPHDLVLVLDDYHLIDDAGIHESIAFVLEHQPPRLHLVLATRSDPPLPLAQSRARGRLAELRAADLRFTGEEAAAYLNDSMRLGLSAADIDVLDARTEGWIAALQLAALSLEGRADATGFISGFAGDNRFVVDYLAEEVLTRQPEEVKRFLLQTSILERLSGPLCDAVTGGDDGQARLLGLERANLFLIPLDDRRQWYRYHHLFAELLQAHLLDERPQDVPELHRRASAWFEAQDDCAQAVGHALAGGDPGRAADLVELAMPRMRRERRETEVARWMRDLPDEEVQARPVLGVAFVGALMQALQFDAAAARLDAIEAAAGSVDGGWPERPPAHLTVVDEANYRALPAHVRVYRAAVALAKGDPATTIAHARAAIALAPEDDPLARSAAGALAGLASWTIGDLAGAHAAYTESANGLAAAGFHADVLGCTVTLGDLRRTQGRLTDAERTYRHGLDVAASAPGDEPLRGTADMHVGLAGVAVERNALADAAEHLAVSRRLGEANGLPQNAYRWRVVQARLSAAEGDLDAALGLLEEAERVYAGDFSPDVQPVASVTARLHLRRDEPAAARTWADDRQLAADDEVSYLREHEHLTLARLLVAEHRADPSCGHASAALSLLDRLLAAAERGERSGTVLEILIVQAGAHDALGDEPAALTALRSAVALARPERYLRLFADEGRPVAALLKRLARTPGAPPYVRDLLAATATAPGPVGPQLVAPLSDRELEVLRLLGGDLDGPDIARRLSVSLNTMRTHTKSIYAKLGVTSRREAVSRARDLELIPGGHRPT